jgi:hypothetical protein
MNRFLSLNHSYRLDNDSALSCGTNGCFIMVSLVSPKKVPQLDSHELLLLMIEVDRHSLRRQSSSFPFQISFRHSRIKLPRQLCPIQCMAQYLEVFGHGRELLLLAQNVGVENRSAIKPKTGHVPIVRGGIHPRFARIKVQG